MLVIADVLSVFPLSGGQGVLTACSSTNTQSTFLFFEDDRRESASGRHCFRFKHDVHDVAADSSVLMHLRPVTFRYRDEVGGANDERQYGLLAEPSAAGGVRILTDCSERRLGRCHPMM